MENEVEWTEKAETRKAEHRAHGSTDYFVAEDSLISVFTVARRGIKVAGAPRSQSPKEQTVKGQRCSGDNIVYTLV